MGNNKSKMNRKKISPLEEAEVLFQEIDAANKTLIDWYNVSDVKNSPWKKYLRSFQDVFKTPLTGNRMQKRLDELRQKLDKLYKDWQTDKIPNILEKPVEAGSALGGKAINLKPLHKAVSIIRKAFNRLEKLMKSLKVTPEEKEKIRKKAEEYRNKYRKKTEGGGKGTGMMRNEDWENIFRALEFMIRYLISTMHGEELSLAHPCGSACETKRGLCARRTTNRGYCWQHRGSGSAAV